jgi:hypothetical protein
MLIMTRRDLFLTAASAASLKLTGNISRENPKPLIRSARLGAPTKLEGSGGDTWVAAWADDDNLYVTSDDTGGINNACGKDGSNLAVSRLTGAMPSELRGETVNCMKDYGVGSETKKEDGGMWKACGITCISGVLYMGISRQLTCPTEPNFTWQGRYSPFPIQETWDASIISSSDHGKTWSSIPKLGRSLFPGRTFSTPFFVQYGKDGDGQGASDSFIYAVSNDGAWNNGNWMTLGRVPRDRIARLDAQDWEFVRGFDDKQQPIWKPDHSGALYVFRAPGRTSMAGIHYIAPLRRYILPQWHYTNLNDSNRMWDATRWEFYEAPTPWGPWTLFYSQNFEPEGWYNPTIPSKFISSDGKKIWLFTAGNFIRQELKLYGLWMMPMTFELA